jgi:hypothetical protein
LRNTHHNIDTSTHCHMLMLTHTFHTVCNRAEVAVFEIDKITHMIPLLMSTTLATERIQMCMYRLCTRWSGSKICRLCAISFRRYFFTLNSITYSQLILYRKMTTHLWFQIQRYTIVLLLYVFVHVYLVISILRQPSYSNP